MSASGPQRWTLLLQMYSLQQQGKLPGGDAEDGNIHPREVTCPLAHGETFTASVPWRNLELWVMRLEMKPNKMTFFNYFPPASSVFPAEMLHGSWRQMRIQSCWRFTRVVTLSPASATTGAHTQQRLGTPIIWHKIRYLILLYWYEVFFFRFFFWFSKLNSV